MAGVGRKCGHDLHAGRTAADDGDPAAAGHDAVVPPRAVHNVTLERFEARNVRSEGVMQHAGRGDHEIRFQLCAIGSGDLPCGTVENRRYDLGFQANPIVETELFDHAAEIALNLVARREYAGPVWFGRKRKLVEL